jgi:hypothetical protein
LMARSALDGTTLRATTSVATVPLPDSTIRPRNNN